MWIADSIMVYAGLLSTLNRICIIQAVAICIIQEETLAPSITLLSYLDCCLVDVRDYKNDIIQILIIRLLSCIGSKS